MGKNIHIIFTIRAGSPDAVSKMLGDEFSNENFVVIYRTSKGRIQKAKNCKKPDIIVINDGIDTKEYSDEIKQYITNKQISNIYVIYHASSKEKHKETIRKICTNASKMLHEASEHHTSGNYGADILNKIAQYVISQKIDPFDYENELKNLMLRPNYIDATLEIKLEILHKSLTPEGLSEAKTLARNFNHNKQLNKLLGELETVEPDCFSEKYIEILTKLRNSLLK